MTETVLDLGLDEIKTIADLEISKKLRIVSMPSEKGSGLRLDEIKPIAEDWSLKKISKEW